MLNLWIDFSKKSSKYIEGECEFLWEKPLQPVAKPVTIATLKSWAKKDSPEEYQEITKEITKEIKKDKQKMIDKLVEGSSRVLKEEIKV